MLNKNQQLECDKCGSLLGVSENVRGLFGGVMAKIGTGYGDIAQSTYHWCNKCFSIIKKREKKSAK